MLDWILSLDRALFTQINSVWTHPWLDVFFPFITDLHKNFYFNILVIPLIFTLLIWRRGLKKGLIIFIFALLSLGLSDGIGTYVFKNEIKRPRPADDPQLYAIVRSPYGGYSFVSNHAANNFSITTFISSFFPAARILLYTISVLICYSRTYNGVHYPTDVFGGALLGILCGCFMAFLCHKLLDRLDLKKKRPT